MITNLKKSDLPNLFLFLSLQPSIPNMFLGWHRAGENYSLKMIKFVEENINQSKEKLHNEIRKKNIMGICQPS